MIRILPRPQHIEEREGRLLLDYHCRITMDSSCPSEVFFYASQLAEQLKKSSGIELLIDRRASGAHKGIVLCMSEEAGITRENKKEKEAYRLEITPEGVTVCAAEKEGLFNGVQTLRQLIIQYGSSLPCLYIEDYPELSVRGWFMDVTRGRIPKMTYLKELADRCSLYKINQLHLYIEHTFLFDGLSEVWRDDTPLTAQDILEFDAYCAERNIELVPSVATFGHLYKVLRTKTFHELSEVEEAEGTAFSFYERMCHHTLNSTDDRAYELVCRLIDEYSPLFRSNLFNINCDETFDLGRGRGKERADEIGSHVMYVQWVNRICEHVKAIGKRPMFWGGILENCRYQVAEREVTAFWEKYDEQTENSQKQIEFCNEAIRNDMAKVSALLVGIEEGKRKYIAPILHMAEGQILINTMFGVIKNVHDGQQNPCTDKRALAEAFEIWYYEYRRQWHKISRESELYRIGELIFWLADYIREL